jgi:hypothetical protein
MAVLQAPTFSLHSELLYFRSLSSAELEVIKAHDCSQNPPPRAYVVQPDHSTNSRACSQISTVRCPGEIHIQCRLFYHRYKQVIFLSFFLQPIRTGPSTRYTEATHVFSPSTETSELLARASNYLLPVYDRPPIVFSHGKGPYVWSTDGNRYLDFTAGIAVNALGHADDGVVRVRARIFFSTKKNFIDDDIRTDTNRTSRETSPYEQCLPQ